MSDKKQVKDLIEEIPNWEYTYIYEGSRTCGKSYIQHLLDEKDKEIERLKIIEEKYKDSQLYIKDYKDEIERLNNIINKAIHFINLNQDEKKLTLNYDDLKKLRGILKNDDFYLTLFEEQLKELKENE